MAPIHHHFEQKGWSESTIVIRFWIIAIYTCTYWTSKFKIKMKIKKIKKKVSLFLVSEFQELRLHFFKK